MDEKDDTELAELVKDIKSNLRAKTRVSLGLPTGTSIEVQNLPQMEIIRLQDELNRAKHQIYILAQKIADLTKRLEHVEKIKTAKFKNNDVYEIHKRIERLQRKIALLESNSKAVSVNVILILIAINNLFLWWIYG